MKIALTSLMFLLCCLSPRAHAAQRTTTGKEWRLWTEGGFSVVVGTIHDTKEEAPDGDLRYRATLKPLATLAGSFDPSLHATLPVTFYTGKAISSIERPPAGDGANVLVVLRYQAPEDERQAPSWIIVADICTFMPDQSALVIITGPDDLKVAATLKKLQEARANPDPSPYPKNSKPAPDDQKHR